jgi:hypothetical protein
VSVEPPIEVPTGDGTTAARDPLLQRLGGGAVLALVRGDLTAAPGSLPSTLASVRLEPWGAWPPVIPAPKVVYQGGWDVPFVSSVEPGGTFALGIAPFPQNNPLGCDVVALFGLSPDAPGPAPFTLHVQGTCNDRPRGVVTLNNGLQLAAADLAWNSGNGPKRSWAVHLFHAGVELTPTPLPVCASTPLVGDVLAAGEEFLFVHSAGGKNDCGAGVAASPARRLVVERRGKASESSAVVYDGTDDLVHAQLLPRTGGAWVVFRESGASAEVQPPGLAMPLGADSAPGAAFQITEPGTGMMSATALGDGLVVAFVDSIDPSAPTIVVRVYSATGTLAGQASFSTSAGWYNGDRLTLVASPDGASFLVGWTGLEPALGSALFVRRFDCATPL